MLTASGYGVVCIEFSQWFRMAPVKPLTQDCAIKTDKESIQIRNHLLMWSFPLGPKGGSSTLLSIYPQQVA